MPDDIRDDFERDIIELVKRRTEAGRDKNGRRFPKYSDAYVNSMDFKNAGKSKNRVDLTLTGDMLASLDVLERKSTRTRIGFERGSAENAKADGNVRGTYGSGRPNPAKARDFMGISEAEYERLLKKHQRRYRGTRE